MKRYSRNQKILIGVGAIIALCIACGLLGGILSLFETDSTPEPQEATAEQIVAEADEEEPTEIPEPTDTPKPTGTPEPTNTPRPTATPEPTDTPLPTSTPTPIPEPILLSGSGDSVVDVEKTDYPAIARISYTGPSNFAVVSYSPSGERNELLVNTIGNYQGVVPIDLMADEHTGRLEISASGPWTIEILSLFEARIEVLPGMIEGTGDDVILLTGDPPDTAAIDASTATSNFAVWGFSDFRDLLVNEIAPYQGTVLLDPNTFLIVIEAEGPWSMNVTSQ